MPSKLSLILLPLLLLAAVVVADEPAKPAAAPGDTPKAITPPPANAGLTPAEAAEIGLVSDEDADRAGAKKVSQIRKHLADILTKYDTNHDGTIDAEEIAKMEGAGAAAPAGVAAPKKSRKGDPLLLKYDMDHNYKLDEIEAAAARDAGKAEALARNAHAMKRFDLNRDGMIDAAELAAAREALAKERQEREKAGARPKTKPAPPAPIIP